MTTTTTTAAAAAAAGPIDPIGADLSRTLRALKLGGLTATLPERLVLARQRKMGHAAFLELVWPTSSPDATRARRCSVPGPRVWTQP